MEISGEIKNPGIKFCHRYTRSMFHVTHQMNPASDTFLCTNGARFKNSITVQPLNKNISLICENICQRVTDRIAHFDADDGCTSTGGVKQTRTSVAVESSGVFKNRKRTPCRFITPWPDFKFPVRHAFMTQSHFCPVYYFPRRFIKRQTPE